MVNFVFRAARLIFALSLAVLMATFKAKAAQLSFILHIEHAQVPANMRLIRVKQGDVVTLRWSADQRTMIHLHGFDIEKTVDPGAPTDMTFTARATGRFTIEPHLPAEGGGHSHGDVLVTIEVYP